MQTHHITFQNYSVLSRRLMKSQLISNPVLYLLMCHLLLILFSHLFRFILCYVFIS